MRRSATWIAAAVLGFGGALALNATGDNSLTGERAAPSSVATLDLEVLFNGLDELKDLSNALQAKIQELKQDPARIKDEMTSISQRLDTQVLSPEESLGLRAEFHVLNAEHKAKLEAAALLVQIEDGRINRDLYKKALVTIEAIAARDGIDLVLLDDRAIPIPDSPTSTTREVQANILARQILFANESIDVTQAVIDQMNLDYGLGR